ncbi:hypothetical protein NDU88_005601 [Pleurodeles waltl]|uniref:Uncharacterized protein n=1 Tax=Pleurodeles waltl TaxID=8319 RepID=A0AAV7VNT8_PLEWA|nr:hypothetical protein NDU88_005601 [Pleurodeles waltl]
MEENKGCGMKHKTYMWMEDSVDGGGTGSGMVQEVEKHNVDGSEVRQGVEAEKVVEHEERMGGEKIMRSGSDEVEAIMRSGSDEADFKGEESFQDG